MYETKYQTRARMNDNYSTHASYELQNSLYENAIKSSNKISGDYSQN
ncbi:MAG: hypothetical protein PHH00_01150 [Candidatus Nanoarchaeia archaeon]|nr:hypothetical protein [Candidatus Nanoarchaeia archaeon]